MSCFPSEYQWRRIYQFVADESKIHYAFMRYRDDHAKDCRYRTIGGCPQAVTARKLLIEQFEEGKFETFSATRTSPGGPIPEAKEYWSEKEELWAWFRTTPFDRNNPLEERRWLCFYGTDRKKLTLIQINIPVKHRDGCISGRVLVDASGDYYLGHKGGLGGGGRVVTMDDFAELIKGFKRESVSWPGKSDEKVFVIGKIGSSKFIGQLQKYVSESERIRTYQKTG